MSSKYVKPRLFSTSNHSAEVNITALANNLKALGREIFSSSVNQNAISQIEEITDSNISVEDKVFKLIEVLKENGCSLDEPEYPINNLNNINNIVELSKELNSRIYIVNESLKRRAQVTGLVSEKDFSLHLETEDEVISFKSTFGIKSSGPSNLEMDFINPGYDDYKKSFKYLKDSKGVTDLKLNFGPSITIDPKYFQSLNFRNLHLENLEVVFRSENHTKNFHLFLLSKNLRFQESLRGLSIEFPEYTNSSQVPPINSKGWKVLFKNISSLDLTNLTLKLHNSRIAEDADVGIEFLADAIRSLSKLTTLNLDLSGCFWKDKSSKAKWICSIIQNLSLLKGFSTLNLNISNNNGLGEADMDDISHSLRELTNIKTLNLNISASRSYTRNVIEYLVQSISTLTNLSTLDLDICLCTKAINDDSSEEAKDYVSNLKEWLKGISNVNINYIFAPQE